MATLSNDLFRLELTMTCVISRRDLLGRGALIGGLGLAAAAALSTPAAAKMPPAAVQYRAKPNGAADCSNCTLFQQPDACKVVSGTISPKGWCSLWTRKA
ncbi:MAG TPA: high-potential iron-sulfur protein [Caulobacteraceae bacterium]|nr:high-potential iron-sulfur protein [Caulobacteraceae bacterium]